MADLTPDQQPIGPLATGPNPTVVEAAWYTRTTDGAQWAVPFPAVVAPNDLILVTFHHDGDTGAFTTPAGWTRHAWTTGGAVNLQVWVYWCDGSEGGTTATFVGTGQEQGVARVFRIAGAGVTLADIESAGSTGSDNAPNAPDLVPTTGSDAYLWLVPIVVDGNVTAGTYPANCPDFRANAISSATAGAARGQVSGLAGGSERAHFDPQVAGIGAATSWRARTISIRPGVVPVAGFTHTQADPLIPSVAFVDTSTQRPTAWAWDFGDGSPIVTTQHPTHAFPFAGAYTVTLQVTNHIGAAATSSIVSVTSPDDMPEGRPPLTVRIAGADMRESAHRASWSAGRSSWLDSLQPSDATVELRGQVDVPLNATVVLGVEGAARPLWSGYVTDVSQAEDPSEGWSTSLSATDSVGRMGQAEDRTFLIPAGTLAQQLVAVAARCGFTLSVDLAPSTGTLPVLAATTVEGGFLDYLGLAEQASNAIVVLRPDGGLRVLVRASVPTTPPIVAIELIGDDSPRSWSRKLSAGEVVNLWGMTWPDASGEATGYWEWKDPASIAAYGTKSSVVDLSPTPRGSVAPADPVPLPWPLGLRQAMAVPRWTVPDTGIAIVDTSQPSLFVEALDWVDREGELWQVMHVSHSVERYTWDLALTLDHTQNAISTTPEPPIEPPVEPGTIRTTVTLASPTKDAQLALPPSGVHWGNGKGDSMAAGYWQGWRYRALVDFGLTFPAGAIRCTKATLYLTTTDQDEVGFGSSPQVVIRRITESWSEGSSVSNSTNAVVWPGPATTSSGAVTRNVPTGKGVEFGTDVTSIVEAARKAGVLHGFRMVASDEDNGSRTTEFWTRERGAGVDARLVATFEVPA